MENTSNPFCFEECEEKSQLANIFNGILLPNELADQLLDAKKNDTNEVQSFVTERLQSSDKQKFWGRIPKSNTPTFESLQQTNGSKIV